MLRVVTKFCNCKCECCELLPKLVVERLLPKLVMVSTVEHCRYSLPCSAITYPALSEELLPANQGSGGS